MRTFARLRYALLTAVASALVFAFAATVNGQQSSLDTIRSDVRNTPPPQPANNSSQSSGSSTASDAAGDLLDELGITEIGAYLFAGVATAPFWGPHVAMDDDFSNRDYFPHYPYDHTRGYLMDEAGPSNRWCALRLDADYVEAFDHLDLVNGHLLLSTTLRVELDGRIEHLGETLPGSTSDELWIGDCNVMFRFAQSTFAEFRAGIGMNWLTDPGQTDLGFNFTYGLDVFPVKPLIFSSVMDAGTLGHAGLFRFRSTAGVAYKRLELYTGYEYTDIGRTHWNGLIGGVRLWF